MERDSTSFIPLKQDDEFPIICPEFSIWDVGIDHTFNPNLPKADGTVDNGKGKQLQGKSPKIHEDGTTANLDPVQNKMVHREIERQRRREMATLYASLRSVLPPNYIKGQRSITDQIYAATNYIRFLQNNIKQLEIKREDIKKRRKMELRDSEKGSSSKLSPFMATVQPCSVGIEVLIRGDFMAEGLTLPLSRILQLLLKEGLNVVDYNSTKFDGRPHYMIQSEVVNCASVDLQLLQTKLISMINTLADIKQ